VTLAVIDASVAVAMIAASQATEAVREFASAAPEHLLAPAHFSLEVRHALLRLERRGVLGGGGADSDLFALESLISFSASPDRATLAETLKLARAETLGMYDAAYLELAMRTSAALASRDKALLEAARRRGVLVHDLR
jgi:predicted nucleic acid-binding protein